MRAQPTTVQQAAAAAATTTQRTGGWRSSTCTPCTTSSPSTFHPPGALAPAACGCCCRRPSTIYGAGCCLAAPACARPPLLPIYKRPTPSLTPRHVTPRHEPCRFAIWPKVRAFLDRVAPGAVVADVGCGNGKYFGVRADVAVLGSDRSGGAQGGPGRVLGWEGGLRCGRPALWGLPLGRGGPVAARWKRRKGSTQWHAPQPHCWHSTGGGRPRLLQALTSARLWQIATAMLPAHCTAARPQVWLRWLRGGCGRAHCRRARWVPSACLHSNGRSIPPHAPPLA